MSYKIIGKYIKDLNFNIPNPKAFFLLSKDITNYKINIDIKSNQVKEKIIEVQTTLNLTPLKENIDNINTKIVYSTIIEIQNQVTSKTEIEKIILIKVPAEIYPELREIFIFIFQNSGFKEVKISEQVDFEKLYNLRKVQ
ncbi:protein-export chaperone SecB [Candidatus Pelagibacter bacterium]|nr:protein-export chaperone SecB [Candidatus Pelagibacter bacterium]MDA9624950.1 protein-export chaperone SecB [Candidatus Pelagibacter bacterium]